MNDDNKNKKFTVANIINNAKDEIEDTTYHVGNKNRKTITYFKPTLEKDCNVVLNNNCIYAGNKAPDREFFIEKTFIGLAREYSYSNIALAKNPLHIYTNAYKTYHNSTPSNVLKYTNKFKNKSRLEYKTLTEFIEEEFKAEAIDIKNLTPFYKDLVNNKIHDLLDHKYLLVPGSILYDNKYIREVEMDKFGETNYEVIALDAKIGEYRKYTYLELILLDLNFIDIISKHGIYKRIEE